MIQPVKLADKTLQIPLIQGGMGVGISLSKLAGHVMLEGAMGVISAAHPGYRKEDFWKHSKESNIAAIHEEIQKAKAIAQGKGLCGVNVMVASENYEEYVKAAVDAGADAIISGAGIPMNLPSIVKDAPVLVAPIVSSGKVARLIMKAWDRHYHRCADFIVIEGSLAGGHLGFKVEDVLQNTCESLEQILADVLKEIIPYEAQYGKKIPVFVAGGIYDGNDIAHFIKLGASGVQMATRFITTYECDAEDAFKQKFIDAKQEDIELVKSPAGLPGRAIRTRFMDQVKEKRFAPTRCVNCMKPCTPATTPYCISDALIQSVCGNVEDGLVFAGANAYRSTTLVHVHDLIEELKREWEAAL